jgi:DNA-binding NarL/FixJ family response regulator
MGSFERSQSMDPCKVHASRCQAQILGLAAQGLSDKAIAAELGLSIYTVRSHIQRFYRSYRIHNRVGAVARWLKGNR